MNNSNQKGVGQHQNCAVCRYRRKRCDETCNMKHYFPHDKLEEFMNAQRLFGTNNMMKMMNAARSPSMKKDLADSLLVEGTAWAQDPVRGCFSVVRDLSWATEFYKKHLDSVRKEVDVYTGRKRQSFVPNKSSSNPAPAFEHQTMMEDTRRKEVLRIEDDKDKDGNLELKLFEEEWFKQAACSNPTAEELPNGGPGESSGQYKGKGILPPPPDSSD